MHHRWIEIWVFMAAFVIFQVGFQLFLAYVIAVFARKGFCFALDGITHCLKLGGVQ